MCDDRSWSILSLRVTMSDRPCRQDSVAAPASFKRRPGHSPPLALESPSARGNPRTAAPQKSHVFSASPAIAALSRNRRVGFSTRDAASKEHGRAATAAGAGRRRPTSARCPARSSVSCERKAHVGVCRTDRAWRDEGFLVRSPWLDGSCAKRKRGGSRQRELANSQGFRRDLSGRPHHLLAALRYL